MSSSRLSAAAMTVAAMLAIGSPTSARTPSRFDDGSFEYPRAPVNLFTPYYPGQSIGPWLVTGQTVDLIGQGTWQATEGDQSVDLNAAGAVNQTFTTTPGTTYTVTYALAGNPDNNPPVKTGKALVDGQDRQDFSFDTTGRSHADMGYARRQFTFVAANPTTELTFASTTGADHHGPVIDDVLVTAGSP
ncbi:choice-of-anchor C family protein [Kitasatospora sp. SUK 42]|uniref:choice-of-anchor C family protein n=1 Tax=Kitasatospora sp. SUK 42 TaxID=1588882 RepID=UPI0018C90C2B|nr:choice-of-anchor C family protein [Kitasatospora sp. SUK 42]MBV2152497.1 choice-of-anchor C family protein [Kitasatospora sp. SUK 42]